MARAWMIGVLFLCASGGRTVLAADADASPTRDPVEISVGVDGLSVFYGEFFAPGDFRLVNVTATVPFNDRFAVEAVFSGGGDRPLHCTDCGRLTAVEMRQHFRGTVGTPVQPFVTYGVAGLGGESGSFFVAGAGLDYHPTRFIGVRVDVQLVTIIWFPVGARASAGVSVPLGRYRPR